MLAISRSLTRLAPAMGVVRRGLATNAVATVTPTPTEVTGTDTWSPNQASRVGSMTGPRFLDVDLSLQPMPKPAIDLIAEQPVIEVAGRVASCDGGHPALGHPTVYINLDDPSAPHSCGYCGLRFRQAK
ncbi:NADH dehydrogenase (ubiquinone) Fe-S protein 6 [Fonticula alba]|uniref:NADH dehydrogenase (Ubiquinone) Fe-S protein 6 n=1 Tax=Fonticula alba TaxID=691883 RepID=A0A058ZEA0_FONAL|nr:NADH dehydrogenase (ubiquinone) Fe-S protein 6 [Fonticula alba]KCV72730.1 NADH dehydrogenase (ubiquinone) Fe-S protein 6 [Fonticula alba]|eukprot:XP_009492431.1 NADH dehydrogenase (ubiquinone) Fe-S protein 6 [Fonticula alba]